MPGAYLAAILVSAGFVLLVDARFALAFWRAPGRTAVAVALSTVFFVAWDLAGIATGVFVKGPSPLYLGVDLAPELPLEEPVFLTFLTYLALVLHGACARILAWRARSEHARGEHGRSR